MKKTIFTNKAPKPIGPYSQAVLAGNVIFGSGQIAIDPRTGEIIEGDIKAQTRRVLESIKAILSEAGFSLRDVVNVTVFLRDLDEFSDFNEVYKEYFSEDPPSRTTVEVSRLPKNAKVEISFIAYKDDVYR